MTKLIISIMMLICALSAMGTIITDDLSREMDKKNKSEKIRINVIMKQQYSQQQMLMMINKSSRTIAREIVKSELKAFSSFTQKEILNQLTILEANKSAGSIKPLWLVNVITCDATPQAITKLAKRDDVASIDLDEAIEVDLPKSTAITDKSSDNNGKEITPSVLKIGADQVWLKGYKGKGVLVALLDTGINYNHIDLKNRMWNGGTDYPNYGYDFANNDNDPKDMLGHGTHCAGIIAGDGSGASQTGIAPEATLMAVKVIADNGTATESSMWSGVQFAIDNLADVLSMSVGLKPINNPNRKVWRDAMNMVLASGAIATVAAANSGSSANSSYTPTNPNPQTGDAAVPWNLMTPGDCPPPWLHPDQTLSGGLSSVISVGATDANDQIAVFSSRGPVTWNQRVIDYTDYPYSAGSTTETGLIRPDIVAPGVNIKSCDFGSTTNYTLMSGTSMATPLTAGVVALMLSKNFSLTPEAICRIIQETAANKPVKKNNTFGAGRISALAAVNAVEPLVNPVDVAIYSLISPLSGSNLTAHETVRFAIKNKGSSTISSDLLLSFQVDNNAKVVRNYDGAPIAPGEMIDFIFTEKADLSEGGAHNLKIEAAVPNDVNMQDNSRNVVVNNFVPLSIPFRENFENSAFPPFGWSVNNPDNSKTWQKIAISGNNSAYVNFFNYGSGIGAKDELVLPAISLAGITDAILRFRVAYRQYNSASSDGLKIYISTNGGAAFNDTPLFNKSGADLATTSPSPTQFIPNTVNQWREESINLSSFADSSIVLKLQSINGYSNNLFVDDVEVFSSSAIENYLLQTETSLSQNYPNPFNPSTTIAYNLQSVENVKLQIYNVKGELIKTLINGIQQPGLHSLSFDGSSFNSGLYFYRLTTPGKSITHKMILAK